MFHYNCILPKCKYFLCHLKEGRADKIRDPEGDGGERSARILMSSMYRDFYKLDDNMYMIEMMPKEDWVGKTPAEIQQLKDKINKENHVKPL